MIYPRVLSVAVVVFKDANLKEVLLVKHSSAAGHEEGVIGLWQQLGKKKIEMILKKQNYYLKCTML